MMLVVDCLSFEVLKLQARQKNNFFLHKMAQTMLSYIFFSSKGIASSDFFVLFLHVRKNSSHFLQLTLDLTCHIF